MTSLAKRGVANLRALTKPSGSVGWLATHTATAKKEGDISSVFVSLSGAAPSQLPERFAGIKRQLIREKEDRIADSWRRLLKQLSAKNDVIAKEGPNNIPRIEYGDLGSPSENVVREIRAKGVAVVRGVIPVEEARGYKAQVDEYVKANPKTKAFPPHDPQVFELYWSPPQVKARSHPNLITAQCFLMNLWHSKDENASISRMQPLAYADRVRIRSPGDTGFALGPHIDGGSVERWEPAGYGLGGVYEKIWQGRWEEYDPWEASCRLSAVTDLYSGAGACSMFRMFQGWLAMSHTGPGEGTLLVKPLLKLATAYVLLRPFFAPIQPASVLGGHGPEFLDPNNWVMKTGSDVTSELQGAHPGHVQELSEALHPHLDLKRTMVHVPQVKPGDLVVWHCDTIHAVDKMHKGQSDSSVMYIPVCPVTEANARYVARQRDTFLDGFPGPDFPGGKGESEHVGRPSEAYLREHSDMRGLRAMGFEKLNVPDGEESEGARTVVDKANATLGFA